ncbi:MAG TPA: methyltransferase domain-containing protein [Caldilineaceae bacterium]|nr:methyltransferase domain-containing protein [Caldilineaceae bacterium]
MRSIDREQWLARWRAEEQQPFIGWDFSYLEGRMLEGTPPWSYLERAAALMDRARSALDMDTGGGEKLLSLRAHWPPRLVATEEYPPNLALVRERLEPLGVTVVEAHLSETDPMPFADGEFDLVLNRHGAFNPVEVARILAPGGVFLTQQVDGHYLADLMALFGATPEWPDATLARYAPMLQAAGLALVDTQEWTETVRFTDVGALVYYLKAIPWTVPDFSVDRYADALLALQERLERGEPLHFTGKLYLIEAHKPA